MLWRSLNVRKIGGKLLLWTGWADACGLDIDDIVQEKIKCNNEKYPVEKAKGKSDKYDKL